MTKRLVTALAFVTLSSTAHAWTLPADARVVANTNLNDSAAAMPTPSGPVIVVNPLRLANAPAGLKEFALAHEYGHITLGHLENLMSQAIPAWAQRLEKEADCYAGRVISDDAAETAAQYFEQMQGPTSGDANHPSGYERAQIVRACHAEARESEDASGETSFTTGDDTSCHSVTRYETVTTYEMRTTTVMQAVPRCGVVMTMYGPQQMCTMVMVPVAVQQQVPVTRQVPRTSQVCE